MKFYVFWMKSPVCWKCYFLWSHFYTVPCTLFSYCFKGQPYSYYSWKPNNANITKKYKGEIS